MAIASIRNRAQSARTVSAACLPRLLREVGEDHVVVEELSLGVEADELAPRPEAGIEGKEPLLTERRGEEELAEVVGEDADRLRIGPFLRGHADLRLHRVREKPPVAVLDGHPDLFSDRAVSLDEHRVEEGNRLRLRRDDAEGQELLLLAAPHGEDPVGRRLGGRLFPVEIVPVPASLRLLPGDDLGLEDGLRYEELPHSSAGLFVFVHPFGDDVPRPGERLLHRGHALFRIDEGGRLHERVECPLLGENSLCKRLQPFLPGDGRPRPAFGTEGEVEVLQDGGGFGGGDLRCEFVSEELPLRERFEDRLAPFVQLGELGEAVADIGDPDLVQRSRHLLSIAGDEGHRRSFSEKACRRLDLTRRNTQFAGDLPDMAFGRIVRGAVVLRAFRHVLSTFLHRCCAPHNIEGAALERGLCSMRSPSLAMASETDVRYGRINTSRWRSRPVRRCLNYPWGRGRRSDKKGLVKNWRP